LEIDQTLADQALREALKRYPQYTHNGARLAWRQLFQGGAFYLEYGQQPARDDPDAWEFQNAVVKGYKRMAGL
jgi:hypothetical protein